MTTGAIASPAQGRLLQLSFDPDTVVQVFGGIVGGAATAKLVDRWFSWRRKKQQQPVELTARIIDDGDKLRDLLLAENKELRAEKDVAVERAHTAELKLARTEPELEKLRRRLTERDTQLKALQSQVASLGQVPVVAVASHGAGGAES